jgi:hypothetical protein
MRYDFWKTTQKFVTLSVFTIDPWPACHRQGGVFFLLSIARSEQGLGDGQEASMGKEFGWPSTLDAAMEGSPSRT